MQPDGRIVAGGYARIGDDDDFVAVRYTTGGAPDNSFSQDGIATIGFGGDDLAYDMVRLSDGRLVLAGKNSGLFDVDFALASLNPNGTPDETFDDDGEVTTGFGQVEWAQAVAVYPDDRILAMGNLHLDGLTMLAR